MQAPLAAVPTSTSPRMQGPLAAAAPAAAADKPSHSAPATRRGSSAILVRRGSQRSCCQNCHVPMSLCHCQKSACCICGLSAQNCSCVGIKAQPPPRPSSAAPRVPPRPSSAAQRCIKCTELAAQLSKAHALSACHAERQAIWERELALARAATSDAHAALQAEQEARARIAAELEELRREHALKEDDHEDWEERERTLHKTIVATTKARDTAEQKERKVRGARAEHIHACLSLPGRIPSRTHARTHARTHPP